MKRVLDKLPRTVKVSGLLALRIFTGAVFILSGWAKCIDLHGSCLKIGEYLTAMGLQMPEELILIGATGLATVEFVTGVLLATGCLRRVAVWTAAAFMAVMLPLTLWIAITDPVNDCGCFGDLITFSNTGTFLKNLVISAAVALLWLYNGRVRSLYPAPVQWLVIVASCAYPLYIGYEGYQTQPLLDFRPFPTGSMLYGDENSTEDDSREIYVYERDGIEKEFSIDALPDSTWSFVRVETSPDSESYLTVYSPENDADITEEIAERLADSERTLLLVISDPSGQFMTRAHYLQELHDYLAEDGVDMFALVGATGQNFDRWNRLTRPNFDAYEAEDTSLKMLVRGSSGVVYLKEGAIVWKRTLGSLSPDFPYSDTDASQALDAIKAVDSGSSILVITVLYLGVMILLYGLGLSPKLLALLGKLHRKR